MHDLSQPQSFTQRRLARPAAVALATIVTLAAASAPAATTSIAVRGGTAPEPFSTFRVLQRPAVGDAAGIATVVFDSKIRSTVAGSLRGIFSADTVAPSATVALQGDPAPPTFFREQRRFKHPTINASAITTFQATSAGGDRGIYRDGGIAVTVVGDTPPGGLQGTLSRFTRPQITDNAGVLFHATLTSPALVVTGAGIVAIDTILMRCFGGDLDCTTLAGGGGFGTGTAEALVVKNDPIPDRPGRFICELFNDGAHASDWGIAFRAQTKSDCGDIAEDPLIGFFRLPYGGAIETIAFQEEASNPFPGVGGSTYASFANAPAIEDDGIVAFLAQTEGLVKESIIFRCNPSVCPATFAVDVVRPSTLVAPSTTVKQFIEVDISNVADISFRARVDDTAAGSRGKGIYIYRNASGLFDRLAVKGDLVPGGLGAEYRRIFLPDLSPAGRLTFRAKVRSPGGQNTIQIYLVD